MSVADIILIIFTICFASGSSRFFACSFVKKVFDAKTIEGSYKSAKPHEFFGTTYSFDVTFKAEITRKAKPVPPVPPTAAETAAAVKSPQAKAYQAYLNAIQAEDIAALKKLLDPEMAKDLSGPDAKQTMKMIKMMSATDIKVLKLVESGKTATLTVSGKQDGAVQSGTVEMMQDGGQWKVQREHWTN